MTNLYDQLSKLQQSEIVLLQIDSQTSTFYLAKEKISIPIGFDLICSKFLKHTPPRYDEIEYAINYIEDEIEKVVSKIPKVTVYMQDQFAIQIAHLCGVNDSQMMKLSRDKYESLFGLYAEVSAGKVPSSFQTDLSPQFYAKLLILREYLHHLDIESINIVDDK